MNMRAVWLCCLLVCAAWALAEPPRVDALLARSAAESQTLVKKALAAGRCWVTETKYGAADVLLHASSEGVLPAGRYRAHFPLALSPLGDLDLSAIALTLSANDAKRGATMLSFVKPDEFTDLTLDFTAPGGQTADLTVAWALTGERAKFYREQALKGRAAVDPDDPDEIDLDLEAPDVAQDGSIAIDDLKKLPYHLAACGVHIEALSPVAVASVKANKIVYKPGEQGTATVVLTNAGATAAQVALSVEISSGLTGARPVAAATVALAPGETKTWSGPFDTKDLYWGADLRATAKVGDGPVATNRFVFGTTKNFWETALVTGMMFSHDYVDPARAEEFMQRHMDNGFTGMESGFWAPDEFGDFTPDPEIDIFFGGQGAYFGSVKGTKNVIAAGHKRGIASTVYSNLWGGDGYDSFEMMRQHPDWFNDWFSTSTDWLENWELQFMRRVPPIHVWPVTNVDRQNSDEAIKIHARELIDSHRVIGWDGVRYDSYYSDPWVKKATDQTRKIVDAELTGYGWGYNSLVPTDMKAENLDVMCHGGQLVMEEGLRHAGKGPAPIAHYQETLAKFRDVVWSHDGHLGICYDVPMQNFNYGGTPLDEIYLSSSILSAGAHPYYGVMESNLGQYPRFALRYSEYLYNNKMRPLKDPEAVISFGAPAKLMDWQWLARTVSLGGDRQRLVIHLLNAPAVPNSLSNLALKTPAALRRFPVTVKLPVGATVAGAWSLCPIPDAHHETLETKKAGDALTVTVPEVRFWNVVVIDYTAKDALPTAAPRTIPLPADPAPEKPKPPVTPVPDDVIAKNQGVVPPTEWVFPAAKPLSILAAHGLWYHEYALDRAFARLAGTRVTDTWYQHGNMRFYPESYEALMDHHVIVIADIDAATFGPVRRAQIKRFVEAGGGVLFLGGRMGYKPSQLGTAFADILPLTVGTGDNRKSAPDGLVLAPAKDALKGFAKQNWAASPRVYWYHEVTPKAGSKVLLTAGDKPMLITGTYGKGRVAAYLGSVQGLPKAGQTPTWEWNGWPALMTETLAWLAEPAKPLPPGPELQAKMKAELLGPGVKKAGKIGPVISRYARIPADAATAQMLLKAMNIIDGDVPVDLGDSVWDSVRDAITVDCEETAQQLLDGAASAKKSLGLRTLGQLKVDGARALLEESYKNPASGGPDDNMDGGIEEAVTEDPAVAAYIIKLGALEGLGNLGDPAALPLLKGAVRTYAKLKSNPANDPREVKPEDELYQEALISALRCGDPTAAEPLVDALLENRYTFVRMMAFLDSPDYPGPEHDATRRQKVKIRRELGRVHQRQARSYAKLAPLPAAALVPLAKRITIEEDRRVAAIAFAVFAGMPAIPAEVQAILKTAKVAAVRELVGGL